MGGQRPREWRRGKREEGGGGEEGRVVVGGGVVMDGVTAAGDTLSLALHLLREHWSRVHWGRGRGRGTEAEGPRGRPLESELQLGNQAKVVKGPSAACRAGIHSGSHLARWSSRPRMSHILQLRVNYQETEVCWGTSRGQSCVLFVKC